MVEQVELKQLDWIDTSEIHERPTIFFRHLDLKASKSSSGVPVTDRGIA